MPIFFRVASCLRFFVRFCPLLPHGLQSEACASCRLALQADAKPDPPGGEWSLGGQDGEAPAWAAAEAGRRAGKQGPSSRQDLGFLAIFSTGVGEVLHEGNDSCFLAVLTFFWKHFGWCCGPHGLRQVKGKDF